jgi:hypothetical protein
VGVHCQGGVAYRVHPAVEGHEPTGLDAARDLAPRHSRRLGLSARDHPMLPPRERLNHSIGRVWADFCTVWVLKAAHTMRVPERWRPVRDVCDD